MENKILRISDAIERFENLLKIIGDVPIKWTEDEANKGKLIMIGINNKSFERFVQQIIENKKDI
jgi:hypothetical protein